jgi:hypothetical protein
LTAPIAFISHSKSDADFCHALYDGLAARGIRPIMDERDFQPGDDLVKKVFDEGIGLSDAVLFVLSPGSVDRPWVREELSVAVIQKLRRKTRLIPILISDLPEDRVPVALAATLWITVHSADDPEEIASKIAGAVYADARPNPIIQPAPAWTREAITGRLGLDPRDEVVFASICRKKLENPHPLVSTREIAAAAGEQGLSDDDFVTALSVLQKHYYIEPPRSARGGALPNAIRLTRLGFEMYMGTHESERFAKAMQDSIAAIVNSGISDMDALAAATPESSVSLLELIVEILEAQGDLKPAIRPLNGPTQWMAQPSLKRRLD